MKQTCLALLLMLPVPVQAEIPPLLPPSVNFIVTETSDSDVPGIYFVCELYGETLSITTVFFKVCRVKGSGQSVVQIISYERYFEEVIVWAAEGFTIP